MKIAVGILASMAPDVLAETLHYWPKDSTSIYIHVDSKFDIDHFSFVNKHSNVVIIPNRHKIMWGGFSLVEAELSLMRFALEQEFDYFLLLSDDTIPLVPVQALIDKLGAAGSWGQLGPTSDEHAWARYRNYYAADIAASNPRNRPLEYELSEHDLIFGLYSIMRTKKYPIDRLYWASNWKVLPAESVVHVVNAADQRGLLYESFRYTINADEHYIQTLLGNTPEGFRCVWNFIYADFDREPKPYILQEMTDVEQAARAGFLFARKVHDSTLSREVTQKLANTSLV